MRYFRLGRNALIAFVALCALAPGLAQAAAPTVVVSPTSGSPGRGLTVTGSNWTSGDTIFVQIGSSTFNTDVVCVLTASSDGTIAGTKPNGNCQVPNVPAGSRSLVAIDQQNQSITATGANFTVVPGLVLTPNNASAGTPASPGATMTVQGHGFTSSSTVSGFKFDGAALTTLPTSMSTDTSGNFMASVTFTVPSTTAGTHTITATDGSAKTGSGTLRIYAPKLAVTPVSGSPGHGLTVSGSGWAPGDTVFVQIGSNVFNTDVVCVLTASPDGTIAGTKTNGNCQVPSVPAGSRSLVGIDQQNQGVQATGTAFPVVPGLTLTPSGASVGTPASPGATVTIQGSGFAGGSSVSTFKFDAAALTTFPTSIGTDVSGTFTGPVTFTVPNTTAGTHTVSASDGANTGSGTLQIFTPKVSVAPVSGSPGHGLTVSGSGWPAGDTVFVQIGSNVFNTDVACTLTASPDGTIAGTKSNGSCSVPSVPAGSRALVAIDQQHQGVLAAGTAFTVVPGLTLTPNGASAGTPASPGATVTVQGSGFTGSSTVSAFKFDAAALTTNPTSIGADGSGTFTGPVTFTVPNTTAGTHTISASDGSKTGTGTLKIYTPRIFVSPTSGSPGRGLTVSGTGWPAGDTVFVQIGSNVFNTDVVCTLTASPDGTVSGTKTNGSCSVPSVPAGSRALVAIDQQNQGVLATGTPFTIVPGLTLTPSGASAGTPASPGATVTMQGSGFTGSSTVSAFKFNAAALTTNPTSIGTDVSGTFVGGVTFTVPATTAGPHTVTATDGSAKTGSATLSIFLPKIAVSPASGPVGHGLTVSGSGWPAGDTIFVQIGSKSFNTDVVCVLTAAEDGAIAGNKSNGNCQVPSVATGAQPLAAIDQQNQGVIATGTNFNVT